MTTIEKAGLVLIVILLFFVFGTFIYSSPKVENYGDVVRVFWHENTRYSIQIKQNGSKDISVVTFENVDVVKLTADVPENEIMYVRAVGKRNLFGLGFKQYDLLEIHIHSEKNIEGGGWNHGKQGSGTTNVVQ